MQSTISGKEIGLEVILALMAMIPIALLWLGGPIVWKAIRTGRLLARGVVYDRESQPGMYYFGVLFWISLFVTFSFLAIFIITHWIAAQHAATSSIVRSASGQFAERGSL